MTGTISRRRLLGGAALAGFVARRPPNIVLVLIDDMSWGALGCYGNRHAATPRLDQLAREGVRFTAAYVTPQCTPTRATILTGQYTARNRMWHVIPWYASPWARVAEAPFKENLSRDDFLLTKGLRAAGYATALIGKWHLTANADGNYESLAPEASRYYGVDIVARPSRVPKEFATGDKGVDRLTDEALEFMRAQRQRPFFCFLSHHTTHGPISAPAELIAKYRQLGYPDRGRHNATYLAAIEHLDGSVGRLLDGMEELGVAEDTAVFFLTDNGGIHEAFEPVAVRTSDGAGWRLQIRERAFDNHPLRAGKGSAYEGGIRVPWIVRWPRRVRKGRVEHDPIHAVDLMPTLFELAGGAPPAGYRMDGESLVGLLTRGRPLPKRPLYWYMPFYDIRWAATPSAVIRDGNWKLIQYFGDWFDTNDHYRTEPRLELYDLRADPGESVNLEPRRPEIAAGLRARLHQWIRDCGSPIPALNPRYDPLRALEETRQRP